MKRAQCVVASIALLLGLMATNAAAVSCNVSAPGVAFGGYDPFSTTALLGSGTITFTCSLDPSEHPTDINYAISLSTGQSNSYVQRQMQGPSDTLGYNLYTSATLGTVWGNGSGGSSTVSGSFKLTPGQPTKSAQNTVYGRIPAQQDVGVGAYSDSITVTVTF